MTFGWPIRVFMPNYVTKEHFDASVVELRDDTGSLRSEVRSLRNEIMNRMDEMTVILKRLDQERVFTIEWIRRIESDVSMVKKHLKLA